MERSSPPIATITSIGGRLLPSLWLSIVALIAFYGKKNIVMATLSSHYANDIAVDISMRRAHSHLE